MPSSIVIQAFHSLKAYCEQEEFSGWDPYDGLNSELFQRTPLRKWDLARWVWIQGFKRSPINFRPLLRVPKGYNPKGIALFLNGYCQLFRLAETGITEFGSKEKILVQLKELADLLLQLKCPNYSGACWGYNFDWQARQLFFFPKNTPNVVVTSFAASALFEAYAITGDTNYLETALSSADFILNDLNRTETKEGFILSYSPLPGNNTVYNASLLGAKTLSYCYHYTKNTSFKNAAEAIIRPACAGQADDGSWVYGLLPLQSWIDSFHTGYNLDAIAHFKRLCENPQFNGCLEKGMKYYLSHFFLEDGTPKYYHNKTYPIDIKCPGQLWVTLSATGWWDGHHELAEKVAQWTIQNMQDKEGYFYYQLKRGISSKTSYMRWSNAFMFNALTYYLKESYGK